MANADKLQVRGGGMNQTRLDGSLKKLKYSWNSKIK